MLFFLNLVQNNIIVPEPVGGTPFYHAVYAHVAHEYIYTAWQLVTQAMWDSTTSPSFNKEASEWPFIFTRFFN